MESNSGEKLLYYWMMEYHMINSSEWISLIIKYDWVIRNNQITFMKFYFLFFLGSGDRKVRMKPF